MSDTKPAIATYIALDEVARFRALNAELEKENRLMNQSIANCASDLLVAKQLNAALVAAGTKFTAYYPHGINPDLDEAYGDMLDALTLAKGEKT